MDSETLERIKRDMESNRFSEAGLTVISLSQGLELVAEVERLRAYTDPKLFAAACNALDAMDGKGPEGAIEEAMAVLAEAVAWWDSLPWKPGDAGIELPKYEASEISPISCNHRHRSLLQGGSCISTEEHSRYNISLCRDCGQFMIRGMVNEQYYSIDFTLIRKEDLEAAGKAVEYYSGD